MKEKDINSTLNDVKKSHSEKPSGQSGTVSGNRESRPPVKKLKRISPSAPRRVPEPENTAPKKKRIVISGELPDYEAIRKQEMEMHEAEPPEPEKPVDTPKKKADKPADTSKKKTEKPVDTPKKTEKPVDNSKKKNDKPKNSPKKKSDKPESVSEDDSEKSKGFFARVKDLMYISAEDDEENFDDTPKEPDMSDIFEEDGSFTVEEIEESTASTLESISEALSAINDEVSVEETKSDKEPEPEEIPEQVEESPKPPEKKLESSSRNKKKKKKKKNSSSGSASTKKSDTVQKTTDVSSEESSVKSDTVQETADVNSEESSVKSDTVQETADVNSEESSIKSDTVQETADVNSEESSEPEKEADSESETVSDNEETSVIDEDSEEVVSEQGEKTEKSSSVPARSNKYNLLALVCIVLALIGVIAIINTFISNIGGKSSKEKFAKVVYPAVIMDINSFESPAELPCDQILSAAIWSVVLDNEKLSKYNEIMGAVNIPAADVESFAVELFGEDIPELTHNTVSFAESKFYYNEETQSYNVQAKPDAFTYAPEVSSVSRKHGEYIVNVEYVEEHPEWMDKSVSKSAEFRLSKNDNGGYKIDSMKILPENPAE